MKLVKTFDEFVNEAHGVMDSDKKKIAKGIASRYASHTKGYDGSERVSIKSLVAAFEYVPNGDFISAADKTEIARLAQEILNSGLDEAYKEGDKIKYDSGIRDGNGKPLQGDRFIIKSVNDKTYTLVPDFSTWLKQVRVPKDKLD